MSDEGEVTLYPPWEEALRRFADAGFGYGDVVRRRWLYDAFGLDSPTAETPKGVADGMELAFLAQFAPFKEHLLEQRKMDLQTKPGLGWEIVQPSEQTPLALRDGVSEIRKALRRMGLRLVHVDHAALSHRQRQENADALARLSLMGRMLRNAERTELPAPE